MKVYGMKYYIHQCSLFDNLIYFNVQLRNLDGLISNFRIKRVYCQNNILDNIEGIKKFKFLETLLISNNRLRNLDKFITFLSKFAFLE